VRLHARTLPGDEAFASVVMPGGELRETAANRGITIAAASALDHPASARVSPAAIQDYLKGKTVSVRGEAEADALTLRLQTAAADLEPGLRLAHLILTEGRLEPDVFGRWQTDAAAKARTLANDPAQRLNAAVGPVLIQDGPRARPPEAAAIARLGATEVQAWLNTHLREAPLEVTLVGSLPRDDLIALGMKYFGTLPRRRLQDSSLLPLRQLPQRRGPVDERVEVAGPARSHVLSGWRIPPEVDARGLRILTLGTRILAGRLVAELHKKRGLIPTPADLEVIPPVLGRLPAQRWMGVILRVDPARAEEAAGAARAVVEQLVRSGPSAAELASVRKDRALDLKAAYLDGAYWARLLEGFDYRGGNRADLVRAPREIAGFGRKDLVDLLRRCVTDDGRFQIIVAGKS
jgi:predicted Zn-dependent peptidase